LLLLQGRTVGTDKLSGILAEDVWCFFWACPLAETFSLLTSSLRSGSGYTLQSAALTSIPFFSQNVGGGISASIPHAYLYRRQFTASLVIQRTSVAIDFTVSTAY
jgi:hypothetical protein